MPSGNWLPKRFAPKRLSRGEGPKGAKIATLNGPISKPIKIPATAAIWIKRRRLLNLRVLSLDNFRIKMMPRAMMRKNTGTAMYGEYSVTIR
jgi:hypothetical protein